MGTAPQSSHSDDRRRPPGIPEQLAGAGGVPDEGATALVSGATEEPVANRDSRGPPRPPRPDAGLRSGKQSRSRGKRTPPPPAAPSSRAQVSRPRGLAQVQRRGAGTWGEEPRSHRRGPRAARRPALTSACGPSADARPPPSSPQPARRSRSPAPPPSPGAAALLTLNFTTAPSPEHPHRRGRGSYRRPVAGAVPRTAHRALRTRTRAASVPRRRPRFRSGHSQPAKLQVPAGAARVPAAWRPGDRASSWFRGGGLGRVGRVVRGAFWGS